MNKTEFVKAIAQKTDVTIKQADLMFEAALELIVEEVKKGDKVTFPGFGTFEARRRAARMGINPQTKERIKIKATTVPAFKAGKTFKETLTSGRSTTKSAAKNVSKSGQPTSSQPSKNQKKK